MLTQDRAEPAIVGWRR